MLISEKDLEEYGTQKSLDSREIQQLVEQDSELLKDHKSSQDVKGLQNRLIQVSESKVIKECQEEEISFSKDDDAIMEALQS